ncbi:uncharacterized protein LOC129719841 [Wyeomyia smithii]|uniref:uncharacterized protein LOC129719841 n=1 Tax=Wyeomyia smithii TaxID=174621 RepID=UPI002467E288|nr:uncharacterized protein LOC129719841 [Wyeomyia smithii]
MLLPPCLMLSRRTISVPIIFCLAISICLIYAGVPQAQVMLTPESTSPSITFIDSISVVNLKQLNVARNCLNRTLDLLFVSEDLLPMCTFVETHEALVPVDPLHPPILATLKCLPRMVFTELNNHRRLDFSRANYAQLNEALLTVDWATLYNLHDIDEPVQCFTTTLTQLFTEHVPVCRPRPSPPWSNNYLRYLKRKRANALKKFSNNRNLVTKRRFHHASSKYKSYNRGLYARYVTRKQSAMKKFPKRFWTFVSEKRKEAGLPSIMFLGDEYSTDADGTCNLFAKQFSRAFDETTVSQDQTDSAIRNVPRGALSMNINEFSDEDVMNGVRKLKSSTRPGPDGIPAIVLIKCARAIRGPLGSIFEKSLAQAVFPDRWKKSIMFPAFKKGDKRDVANYRGVTSLSAKLFEILVGDELFRSAKSYSSQDQHGFFSWRSTATNLVQFTYMCLKSMEQGSQIDTVYTDLSSKVSIRQS